MTTFSKNELERYGRQMLLPEIGTAGQEKLKNARVLVVGAGGLGCPALQYLAAAGVGTIGIIDGDDVCASNLHRQLLFREDGIGRNKALSAAEKLSVINPFIRVISYPFFLDRHNAEALVAGYDLVIDGSDNFSTRYLVNDACIITGKPFIYAALHRFELQVAVFNLNGGPTYRCLYPEPPADGEMPSCAEAGVIGVLPGVAGTLQALEALKIITGTGDPLSGKLLTMNLLNHEIELFNIVPDPSNQNMKTIAPVRTYCQTATRDAQEHIEAVPEIGADQLEQWITAGNAQLIDVRSAAEFRRFRLNRGEINVPLDQLPARTDLIDKDKYIVTLCLSGLRSRKAALLIKKTDERLQVFSLKNGLNFLR